MGAQGIKLDSTATLPALGILFLLSADGEALAADITAAQDYLDRQKGFRTVAAQETLLLSVAMLPQSMQKNPRSVMRGLRVAGIATRTVRKASMSQVSWQQPPQAC
ncbi:MAG: hypothetical protein FWC99_04265 [Coriobacteriia bacterium]|nr:hypothetical protein [Coriobacteriia bacterium]